MSALVYTLRAVLGGGNLTTQPPNTELTALSCGSPTGDCTTPGATSGSDEPCDAAAGSAAAAAGGGAVAGGKGGSKGKGGVTL